MKNLHWAVPVLVLIVLPVALFAQGCGSDEESNDSPRVEAVDADATVIAFPNEFTSVAAKCFGTDMLYAARNINGRAITVSPNHPWCADGVLTRDEQQS